DYWCDICSIRAYTPGPCVCCGCPYCLQPSDTSLPSLRNVQITLSGIGNTANCPSCNALNGAYLFTVNGCDWNGIGRNWDCGVLQLGLKIEPPGVFGPSPYLHCTFQNIGGLGQVTSFAAKLPDLSDCRNFDLDLPQINPHAPGPLDTCDLSAVSCHALSV
ncbi:MAG: hypothetical protein KGL35_23190, partial [Bradyrhizobium sp.]|nr:hypothetical protein [Bradyrhizobium sp.]